MCTAYPSLANAITNFGDDAVTGALAVTIVAYMALVRDKKAALTMASAFISCVVLLALAKMALFSRCETTTVLYGLRSPSGHSGMTIVVYGLSAAFIATALKGWAKVVPYLLAGVLAVLVSISRVLIHAHSESDVIVGSLIGLATSVAAWKIFMHDESVHLSWKKFLLVIIAVLLIVYGMHFSAEGMLQWIASLFRRHIPC
jgi:undecaprenyl-diphosphatase